MREQDRLELCDPKGGKEPGMWCDRCARLRSLGLQLSTWIASTTAHALRTTVNWKGAKGMPTKGVGWEKTLKVTNFRVFQGVLR